MGPLHPTPHPIHKGLRDPVYLKTNICAMYRSGSQGEGRGAKLGEGNTSRRVGRVVAPTPGRGASVSFCFPARTPYSPCRKARVREPCI